jgi:hypothetical protein
MTTEPSIILETSIASAPLVVKSVRLILPAQPGPVLDHIGEVMARQIQERCEAKVGKGVDAKLTVELAVVPGIGGEGFRIEDRPGGGVRIDVAYANMPHSTLKEKKPGRFRDGSGIMPDKAAIMSLAYLEIIKNRILTINNI